jgi:long-chain acyl-CoA synthetase
MPITEGLEDPMAIPGTQRFGPDTFPQALVATARRRPDATFLRVVPAKEGAPLRRVSFGEFERSVRRAAAFLRASGLGRGDRILLFAENSPEWQAVSLAAQTLQAEPAGLFANLGEEAARGLAQRVRPRVAYVSTAAQWAKLAPEAMALATGGLATVLSHEPLAGEALPAGVRAATVAGVLDAPDAPEIAPAEFDALVAAGQGEDPYLLLFTSGTTGRFKGVRLPQRAMIRAIEGGWASTGCTAGDEGLHFLPFGHVAGHDQFLLALAQGHGLIMVSRREDIPRGLALGPTYLFSVPLVYDRIREQVQTRVASRPSPVRALVQAALAAAQRVSQGAGRGFADRALALFARQAVGRPVRARLGGRVRSIFSGGAATPTGLAAFFESLGLPFVELYGMSETAGLISSNLFAGPRRIGSAGYPSSDLELRIAEDGELYVRGGTLMTGYLDAEDEADAYTPDGFFRTGDLARLDADGTLEVVGRKKCLLVLSTGKKLSPEPIEQAIASAPPFAGAVLLGDGRPFAAAAVFVPQPEIERIRAEGRDVPGDLLSRARAALEGFSEYEKPKRLLIISGALADYPALLTPTLKLKRDAFQRWQAAEVEQLYRDAAAARR